MNIFSSSKFDHQCQSQELIQQNPEISSEQNLTFSNLDDASNSHNNLHQDSELFSNQSDTPISSSDFHQTTPHSSSFDNPQNLFLTSPRNHLNSTSNRFLPPQDNYPSRKSFCSSNSYLIPNHFSDIHENHENDFH
jgi:hypothetical protein